MDYGKYADGKAEGTSSKVIPKRVVKLSAQKTTNEVRRVPLSIEDVTGKVSSNESSEERSVTSSSLSEDKSLLASPKD